MPEAKRCLGMCIASEWQNVNSPPHVYNNCSWTVRFNVVVRRRDPQGLKEMLSMTVSPRLSEAQTWRYSDLGVRYQDG